jgi:hypothetical protein
MAILNVNITDSLDTFRVAFNSLATRQGDIADLDGGLTPNIVDAINEVYLATQGSLLVAGAVDIANINDAVDYQVMFVPAGSSTFTTPLIDTDVDGLTYNPSTGTVKATTFEGSFVGSITNATNADSAGAATTVDVTASTSAGNFPLVFHEVAAGTAIGLYSSTGISVNASTSTLSVNGDVIAFSASDERLKKNIIPISNAVKKVKQLSGNTFEWYELPDVHDYSGTDVGVIAQEVEAIFPELVMTRPSGYKAVRYDKLVAVLIEAVKELSEEIDLLKGNN